MKVIRAAAVVAALLIAGGAFEPFYLRILFADRAALAAMLTDLPFRKTPHLRRFYTDARDRTPAGCVIAIAGPYTQWYGAYEYMYARSMYMLAGRRIVPLYDEQNRWHPEKLGTADFIAAYRTEPRVAGFQTVWRGPDGTLLRRVR